MKLSINITQAGWPRRAIFLLLDFGRHSFAAGFWFRMGNVGWWNHSSQADHPHWGKGWHAFRFWRFSVELLPTGGER